MLLFWLRLPTKSWPISSYAFITPWAISIGFQRISELQRHRDRRRETCCRAKPFERIAASLMHLNAQSAVAAGLTVTRLRYTPTQRQKQIPIKMPNSPSGSQNLRDLMTGEINQKMCGMRMFPLCFSPTRELILNVSVASDR